MANKETRQLKQTARRVFLDSTSPSFVSIIRTTIIVLIIVSVWGTLENWVGALKGLFFMLILSVFFAYLLNPLVDLIRTPFKQRHLEKFMPRSLAIVVAYLIVFTVLGVAISYLAPKITEQAKQLGANIPAYSSSIQIWFKEIVSRYEHYQIPTHIQEDAVKKIGEYLALIGESVTSIAGTLILTIVLYMPWLVLVPVISFFLLKDVNTFRVSLLRLFPSGNWRFRAESFLNDVNSTLAAYTRAQLLSCLLIGTICTLGFYLLGLNYGLLIGILAGILEFIPLIGPLTVALIAVSIAIFNSPWQALSIAIFLIVLRIVHDYVTYPRIVREGIHLHPLAVVLSVLAGEQIAGIPGVFLSIPVVAIATVVFKHVREHRGSKGLVAELLGPDKKEANLGEDLAT